MTRSGEADYALGWRIRKLDSGAVVHEHTGSVRGFLASIRRNPDDDGCLFVLANSDDPGAFNIVRTSCENLLEGREPVDYSNEGSLEKATIAALVGTYRDKQGRTLTISRDGAHAKAVINWHGPKTFGYIGTDGDGNLLFGTMARYDAGHFTDAEKLEMKRNGDDDSALVLKIAQAGKSIQFDRMGN